MRYGLPPEPEPVVLIRVLMQRTTKATLDGGRTEHVYEVGHEYDLPEWLALAFFAGGEADPAEAHAQPSASQNEGAGSPGEEAALSLADASPKVRSKSRQRQRGA
jgi:hypothetical protein